MSDSEGWEMCSDSGQDSMENDDDLEHIRFTKDRLEHETRLRWKLLRYALAMKPQVTVMRWRLLLSALSYMKEKSTRDRWHGTMWQLVYYAIRTHVPRTNVQQLTPAIDPKFDLYSIMLHYKIIKTSRPTLATERIEDVKNLFDYVWDMKALQIIDENAMKVKAEQDAFWKLRVLDAGSNQDVKKGVYKIPVDTLAVLDPEQVTVLRGGYRFVRAYIRFNDLDQWVWLLESIDTNCRVKENEGITSQLVNLLTSMAKVLGIRTSSYEKSTKYGKLNRRKRGCCDKLAVKLVPVTLNACVLLHATS